MDKAAHRMRLMPLNTDWSTTSLIDMGTTVGAYEAKTHFAQLLERAERGEVITISRHGVSVAQLGPVAAPSIQSARNAADEIRRLRQGVRLDGLSLIDLKNEGRR